MTHMRYWAMMLATAAAGAFIAVERFAFVSLNAVWIAFGVAIAAGVFSLGATVVALLRENHSFSGMSGLTALLAGFVVIATRTFTAPTALWLAFAGGIALLLVSLRALALHETTVERVVHQLDPNGATGSPTIAVRSGSAEITGEMRSWLHWLGHTGAALTGGFVVATTYTWPHATAQVGSRWLWFGLGAAVASIGLGLLADALIDIRRGAITLGRLVEISLTTATVAAAGALVAMTAWHGIAHLRWWTFGLGAGIAGAALAALIAHEFTTERVRHELEVAHETMATEPGVAPMR